MKARDARPWLTALLVLAVTACAETPIGPDAADPGAVAVFKKPGGGGPPTGDIALEVTFADGADGIRSDCILVDDDCSRPFGDSVYVHKQEFVSAVIRANGQLYFQTFAGKRRDPVLRGVTVDLSSPIEVFSPSDAADFAAAVGPAWPVFTSDVTLHTRDTDGGLYTMVAGETLVDGGKIAFVGIGDGSWEWRLLFDSRENANHVADGVGLCVTRDAVGWQVTAEAGACGGAVDGITELWRVQGSVLTHVADFNTPMHLTLVEK